MKALVFDKVLQIRDVERPEAGEGEALVKVRMAGICHTDVEITMGYMGFTGIPGHEFVGEVEACSDSEWIGKRVVGEINIGCGVCESCRRGMERHCPVRSVLGILKKDGAFAEYFTLPVKNLVHVPESIRDEEAVFIEPLAAAYEILEQVHIEPTHNVAIVGDGKLSQLIARVLRFTGCRIRVFGQIEKKLGLLKDLGIETALSDKGGDEKFDVVVEASGDPSGFSLALDLVRPRGHLVLKSTIHEHIDLDAARLVIDEIRLVGSRCGRFEPALRLLQAGLVDVKCLISEIFPFDRAPEAFEAARKPGVLKVLLNFR